ncbi:U2 small nuclear ribonucleoprotein B'' [Galdieria sulphuraria]|uniref:U2 small nuclear ribonucleoprotein B n=1 Tax=Galdieria sulphuraria TaxID=130081 RepID=M2XK23_GALSU|nr:U2 small nuclear ribonucleoprotein B'' [Galdieria sulphuraria]EME30477.1 U2 small nuclear ribonucleoprotein B'' [Galdieria sulphuraria]GJD06380.1 U2 small nuclear ribonucleoprotein B'' [Galdieria sulphuraria]|eukprot:XP_005706997.1 U2 small nuclear ribonucleoprotein B'' [Galdieria sulphuraria]
MSEENSKITKKNSSSLSTNIGNEKTTGARILQSVDVPPNQTIYIRNLDEKVKKQELRQSLYEAFSQFGRIVDVVALKTTRMRGQAFIAFEDIASATNALRGLQGFLFYNKPMVIQYAKAKSEKVAKLDGTFVRRSERKPDQDASVEPKSDSLKRKRTSTPVLSKDLDTLQVGEPNHVLFIAGIPQDCSLQQLESLFVQFPGYKETRLAAGQERVAFVEFETEDQATVALQGMQGFRISETSQLSIVYAKK